MSNFLFYIAGIVAVASTLMVVTRLNAVHALLYMIVSLLSVALIFFMLGAPFAAALEVIVYAGAIMVLFVFVIMMLNLSLPAMETERQWVRPAVWIGPAALTVILLGELVWVMAHNGAHSAGFQSIGPRTVSLALFGPYLLGVELASILLLAGLVSAYHLARPETSTTSKGGA